MRKLIVTVSAKTEFIQGSGRVYIIDLNSEKIEKISEFVLPAIYDKYPLPNGVLRGYRGLDSLDGVLYVANFDSILIFDNELNLLSKFTHPYLADIHEIRIVGCDLYVVSTFAESVLRLPINDDYMISRCEIFWEGNGKLNPEIEYRYTLKPAERHYHYNSVMRHSNGDFYVLASQENTIINVTKNKRIKFDSLKMPHDLMEFENRIFLNNTDKNQVVSFNPDGTDYRVEYFDSRIKINHGNDKIGDSYGFLLGLHIDKDNFYIGTSPASVKVVSRHNRSLSRIIKISNNVEEGVHAVKILENL